MDASLIIFIYLACIFYVMCHNTHKLFSLLSLIQNWESMIAYYYYYYYESNQPIIINIVVTIL